MLVFNEELYKRSVARENELLEQLKLLKAEVVFLYSSKSFFSYIHCLVYINYE